MKGFKAFKNGLICKDKQYAENTVFYEPEAEICKKGMHFCTNPFDVLDHYPLVDEDGEFSDFAEVESLAKEKTNDHKKFCTTKLKIGAKLSFAGFIKACVDFCVEKTIKGVSDNEISSGNAAQIGSSGNDAQIGSSGNDAQIGSSGNAAQIGSSGNDAQIGSSGDYAQIGSSGDDAKIGSSGYDAKIGSSGDYAQIGSSGDYARIGSSGNAAQIGSSGNDAQIGSSGNAAQIGSSGDDAQIGSSGDDAVICCAGNGSIAKAKKGSWITLAEWIYSEEKRRYIPFCVKTEFVDGKRIKEDTFYKLKNREFVKVEDPHED